MGIEDFDEMMIDEIGDITLILQGNKSHLYVENFQKGLIKRGFGKIIRDVLIGDRRYIHFNKELDENKFPETGTYLASDRWRF